MHINMGTMTKVIKKKRLGSIKRYPARVSLLARARLRPSCFLISALAPF